MERLALIPVLMLVILTLAAASACRAMGAAVNPAGQAAASTSSPDWLNYQHDPARSGVSSDQQPLGKVRQLWAWEPLDRAGYARPLVAGKQVIVATEGGSVYALEAATGKVA